MATWTVTPTASAHVTLKVQVTLDDAMDPGRVQKARKAIDSNAATAIVAIERLVREKPKGSQTINGQRTSRGHGTSITTVVSGTVRDGGITKAAIDQIVEEVLSTLSM